MGYDRNFFTKRLFDTGPTCSQKCPNRAKSYYSFHLKSKGDKALILIYLDNPMTIFDFSYLQEVNWGQS